MANPMTLPTEKARPWPLLGYAPGHYTCNCSVCSLEFEGDKRAFMCLPCAASRANEALASRKAGGVRVKPLSTQPQELLPDKVHVHEGSWALVIGTNGKPAGWIDTHELFAHQLYCDQILSASDPGQTDQVREANYADDPTSPEAGAGAAKPDDGSEDGGDWMNGDFDFKDTP